MPPYAQTAREEIEIPARQGRLLSLTPRFDFQRLYQLSSTTPAQLEFEISVKGYAAQRLTDTVLLEPINRIVWEVRALDDSFINFRKFVVALVTPADLKGRVHQLIKEASSFLRPPIMDGYQSGEAKQVSVQLHALYLALQERGYNYTSVSEGFFEGIQRVRPASVSLEHNTGNCIEGTLVFAAAAEALGMDPEIVFVPGHAFFAMPLMEGSKKTLFLTSSSPKSARLGRSDPVRALLSAPAQEISQPWRRAQLLFNPYLWSRTLRRSRSKTIECRELRRLFPTRTPTQGRRQAPPQSPGRGEALDARSPGSAHPKSAEATRRESV